VISRNSVGGAYPLKRLDEVVEFLDSKRRPVTESDRRAGPYPYFGANGQQGTIDDYIFDEPLVLLAEDGGHFGEPERGIAYRISGKTWVNNHAHVLRPKNNIDLAYLCRVLEHYDVTPFVTGTTRGKLTQAGASEIPIPLPPFSEQRHIAEILDRAEALRAKRRASLAQLDILIQAIFFDLHQEAQNTSREVSLVDIAETTRGSFVNGPFGSDLLTSELQDEGVPVVYIRDIRNGEYRRVSTVCVTERKAHDLAVCAVRPKDVLVAKVGDPPGIAAIYPDNEPLAIVTQDVIRIRVSNNVALPEFIVGYLNSSVGRWKVSGITIEATRARFSLGDFKKLKIELPSIDLQSEFARRVAAVEKLKAAHRASLAKMDALFASLQHRAFRGEL
jgi:type I restriction enzyme, S subunit